MDFHLNSGKSTATKTDSDVDRDRLRDRPRKADRLNRPNHCMANL